MTPPKPTFLHDPDTTFLNHGSFGATPLEILEVQRGWQLEMERNPVAFLDRALAAMLDRAAARAGRFLNADPADLVFVPNATTGANAVLGSLALGPGDELLTSELCYGAVSNAMLRVAHRTGARVVHAPLPWPLEDPVAVADAVEAAFSSRTRVLVIDHISSAIGVVFPVAEIVSRARARGIQVLVDGAHAPGQVEVDLRALDADWWVGNLHKWVCAPKGAALLWTAPRHHEQMRAPVISHGYREGYKEEFGWPGTFDPSAWLASTAAIELHETLGGARFREANHRLVQVAREILADAMGAVLPHPDDPAWYAAMAALPLPLPSERSREVTLSLYQRHGIEVPVSPWRDRCWLRVSGFSAYNRPEQYEYLARVLPGVVRDLS